MLFKEICFWFTPVQAGQFAVHVHFCLVSPVQLCMLLIDASAQDAKNLTLPEALKRTFGAELADIITERIGPIDNCPPEPLTLEPATESLMPNGLAVPGICHLTHNTVKDIISRMHYWDQFWQQLKQLEGALTNEEYMRVPTLASSAQSHVYHHDVVAVDFSANGLMQQIAKGPYAESAKLFKRRPPKLYDKRWSVIADFLKVAWPQ
eukprot:4344855-Amphidinium_carterae.1